MYYGEVSMFESSSGVQARFKEKNEKLLFVHCYRRWFNLILIDSIGREKKVTLNFYGDIQFIYSF